MMPAINITNLSETAKRYAMAICVFDKSSQCYRLRASKPQVTKTKVPDEKYGYRYEPDAVQGQVAYVWRMVAFAISPNPKHQCMPICADFDLGGDFESRGAQRKALELIEDEIVKSVPRSQWHGVIRWGQAFGQIGTPRYAPDGAVIYR
jgi:hypothetical protein